ncbi:MAG: AAA family ATPase [Patescibacteria group bacterium]
MISERQKIRGAETGTVGKNNVPVLETESSVAYLGVELPKGMGGEFCPKKEKYQNYINEEFSLKLQRKIATSWKLDQPIMIEGGTSIGKTTTVRKMCAELGWEVYYKNLNGTTDVEDLMGRYVPNPDRKTVNDPEYKWSDGQVTQGLRQENEKIKVIILDEYNSANPNIIIRLHEVLDELEKNGEVVLAEDASERVKVGKSRTKIIALTNPPGKGYLDRQPLDPAQLRRWNYQKEVTELPRDTVSVSMDIMFHMRPETKEMAEEKFLFSNDVEIPAGELREAPGMKELFEKYKEFHYAAKELLKNREIAQDQPQAFMYDDRMEPQKVLKFIQNFYRGDINAVWKNALEYFYVNKLEDDTDRQKLLELINAIEYVPPVESRRKGLERESPEEAERLKTISEIERVKKRIVESGTVPDGFFEEKREGLNGALAEQIKDAKEILGGKDVLGIEEIEKAFGIRVRTEDIPRIPFSKKELENAKESGQFLILRVDKAADGTALTMKKMYKTLTEEFEKSGDGKLLYDTDWYGKEAFFTKNKPGLAWALVSKEIVPDSENKNYLEQTERLIDYIKNSVFKGTALPKEYQDALREFSEKKPEIAKLMDSGSEEAANMLAELSITKLTRQSPTEVIYDMVAYFKSNHERLLQDKYTWTAIRSSGGEFVYVGSFGVGGAGVGRDDPRSQFGGLGVSFSRSV